MPRRQSFHDRLDQLQAHATAEKAKARDLDARLEAAKVAVESASRAITDAYAAEDERAVRTARRKLEAAEIDVADLGHRVAAASQRVERT